MRKPSEQKTSRVRPRISEMPVLPVFYKLSGKRVLIVGGSEDALWKAELARASGARLKVIAEELCDDFTCFIDGKDDIELERRPWCIHDFTGMAMAIGAFEEAHDARAFSCAARDAGVPVNTVDQPETCDFQFGSIVNRAPAVVAISTDGAAPILGQAMRRRIETLLPDSLGAWAQKAKSMRQHIAARFTERAERLKFWRLFAEKAFQPDITDVDGAVDALMAGSTTEGGRVSLVGAGPGAADLLTMRAVRTLQAADVILFDDLVSSDVLELARREAKRFTVGKRGGRDSCRQEDITNMMIKFAKQGLHVVRLKSGDPMVFGRAGEEIEQLEKLGIDVAVVPGITAAIAAASSTKTSLTHRDKAQGVKFITAHSKKGELPELDWRACADQETSLMIYMGAATAPKLAAKLRAEGMDDTTPVMVAKAISRPEEEVDYVTLQQLQTLEINRENPVLIGIGDVFSEAKQRALLTAAQDEAPNVVNY